MKEIEAIVLKHLKNRAWDNLRPGDIAKSIMIEGAELLEHFQWDSKSLEEVLSDSKKKKEIANELADVLIYAIELSVLLNLDTKKIILSKLSKVQKKYPAKLMRQTTEPGTESAYWKIKKVHRKNKKQ